MNRMTITLGATMLVLGLGGCERNPPANALDEGNATVESNVVLPAENVAVAPPPVNASDVVTPAAPPPAFTQDEQMKDDADATGLTSRLPDEPSAPGQSDNQTRPAEQ